VLTVTTFLAIVFFTSPVEKEQMTSYNTYIQDGHTKCVQLIDTKYIYQICFKEISTYILWCHDERDFDKPRQRKYQIQVIGQAS